MSFTLSIVASIPLTPHIYCVPRSGPRAMTRTRNHHHSHVRSLRDEEHGNFILKDFWDKQPSGYYKRYFRKEPLVKVDHPHGGWLYPSPLVQHAVVNDHWDDYDWDLGMTDSEINAYMDICYGREVYSQEPELESPEPRTIDLLDIAKPAKERGE